MIGAATDVRRDIERGHEQGTCPVDGCGRPIKSTRVLCRDCWARVPLEIKQLVRERARAGSWERWVDAVCAAVHASEVGT